MTTQTTINPDTLTSHTKLTNVGDSGIPSYGLTVFWTVHTFNHTVEEIEKWANKCKIPEAMKGILQPNDITSSFEKATNLEGSFKKATPLLPSEAATLSAFFTSRKVKGDSKSRILVRETVDNAGKTVATVNLGVIALNGSNVEYEPYKLGGQPEDLTRLDGEISSLINDICNEVTLRSSNVEDQKVRTGIQKWVESRNGSSLRGRGGVYFIPHKKNQTILDDIVAEVKAIQCFLSSNKLGSLFCFITEQTDTISSNDLVDVLKSELKDEINTLIAEIQPMLESTEATVRQLTTKLVLINGMLDKVKTYNSTFNNKFANLSILLSTTKKGLEVALQTAIAKKAK